MTTQSLAYRIGSAIGVIAGALLSARKPTVRWTKRALVFGLLFWVFVANFSWVVSSLLTLGSLGLLLVALTKGDLSRLEDPAPGGYDSLGQALDVWGNPAD